MDEIQRSLRAMQRPPHNLTQGEIARLVGINQPTVSKWCKSVPQAAKAAVNIIKLADVMGIRKVKHRGKP